MEHLNLTADEVRERLGERLIIDIFNPPSPVWKLYYGVLDVADLGGDEPSFVLKHVEDPPPEDGALTPSMPFAAGQIFAWRHLDAPEK
jgi:hypothetical protein